MSQSERIQQVRKLMGLTQSEIAFHMGVAQGTYSFYEKNRDIPERYHPILSKMGVNLSWLKTGIGEPIDEEAYLQFKKYRDNSEVSVVDVRVSPNVVLPFVRFGFRQAVSRGERIKDKSIIVREDDVDYNGAIVVEAGNEKMEPTILPGEKLLCMPVSESSVNYVTGVVFVVFGDMALVRRIKTNEAGKDIVILTTDDESETVSVRKSDVIKIYRVVMSISRPIC